MYTGIKHLHSMLAYVLLAALIISFLYVLFALIQKKGFNRKMAMMGFIAAHLQLLVGLIMYFVSPYGMSNLSGDAMKESVARLYALEHPLMMIVSIILITVGYIKAKKMTDPIKQNKTVMIYYLIGIVLILSRIPWHVWPAF